MRYRHRQGQQVVGSNGEGGDQFQLSDWIKRAKTEGKYKRHRLTAELWLNLARSIRKIARCVAAPSPRCRGGQMLLALEVNYERDETLAAGVKYERNCGRLKNWPKAAA